MRHDLSLSARMSEGLTILATSVSVAASGALAGLWVLRAVVARDVKPLNDVMIGLTSTVKSLTDTLLEERDARKEERKEMQHIVRDLELLVRDLDRRTTRLESLRLTPLER